MAISTVQASYQMQANATLDGVGLSGTIQIGPGSTPFSLSGVNVAYAIKFEVAIGDTITLNPYTGAVTGADAGVSQVETATIVAASGATSNGNLAVSIVMSGVAYPITVALNTVDHTTADLVADEIRDAIALAQGDAVTALYTVGGTGANVTLTRTLPAANDPTLNIAVTAGLGVSAIVSSTNTTAGLGPTKIYRIDGQTYDTEDYQGVALTTIADLRGLLIVQESGNMEFYLNSNPWLEMIDSEVMLNMSSSPLQSEFISYPITGDAQLASVFTVYAFGTSA